MAEIRLEKKRRSPLTWLIPLLLVLALLAWWLLSQRNEGAVTTVPADSAATVAPATPAPGDSR